MHAGDMRSLIPNLPEKPPKIKGNLSLSRAILKTLLLFPGASVVCWKVPCRVDPPEKGISFVVCGDLAGEGVGA